MSDKRQIKQGERIKLLRDSLGLSQIEFAKALGITQPTLSAMEKGRSSLSLSSLEGIIHLVNIDMRWLLFGEGDAPNIESADYVHKYSNRGKVIAENGKVTVENSSQIFVEAVCNAGGAVPSDLLNETSPIKVPGLPDGAVVIKVSGLSMAPTILDQDYIACMPVKERSAVRYGEIHLLITTQSMLYAKRLYAHEEGFQLTSDNRNYPVIHLKESEVAQIYDVVGRITPHITTAQEFDQEERMRRIEESFEALFLQSRKS